MIHVLHMNSVFKYPLLLLLFPSYFGQATISVQWGLLSEDQSWTSGYDRRLSTMSGHEVPGSNLLAAAVVLLAKACYPNCIDPWKGLQTCVFTSSLLSYWPGKINPNQNTIFFINFKQNSIQHFTSVL